MAHNLNNWDKVIFHIDMNAFFASIEQRDNSKLFYRLGGGCAILFTLVIFFGISLKNNRQLN